MRHKNSRNLFNYWDRLKAGRPAPKREEIEPSDIREILGDTFILDISSGLRTISYRLAGTRLCAAYGKELKGQGYLVPWDETDCFEVARMLTKVYRDHQPHLLGSIGKTDSGKFAEFETVFLPIQPVGDGNHRILGISTPSQTPFWLGAEPITSTSVKTMRSLQGVSVVNKDISMKTPPIAPNLADLAAKSDTEHPTKRRVAHLTVHDGGKI